MSILEEPISDDMELEQELINNYWQMPLPKSTANHRPGGLELYAFNDVIASNNQTMLRDMGIHTLDESLDRAMEERGEVCSILDLIKGQKKPRKLRKTKDLVPLAFVRFDVRGKGKGKPVTVKALLDSGGSGTLITEEYAKKLSVVDDYGDAINWDTAAGVMKTYKAVKARFTLPELHDNRLINWNKVHVAKSLGAYDMIIGRDLLTDLGIDIRFSDSMCAWDGEEMPFKDRDESPLLSYHVNDKGITQNSVNRVKEILDAKYEPANLDEVVDNQEQLDEEQKEQLRTLLEKYSTLFDGTLGSWEGEEYDIELKEGAKPYHAKAFPIPRIHMETLKLEVDRLCRLGVLKKVNRSE